MLKTLPRCFWGQATGVLELLQNLSTVHVTGGWLRDCLLETQELNPVACAQWQRVKKLTANGLGDLDVIISERSTVEFFELLRHDEALKSVLRRPPLLVPEKGSRTATVKLLFPEVSVDITSLEGSASLESKSAGPQVLMKEDSCHRDTTFNSLYLEVETGTLHDVTGGLPDLAQGLVRSPHPEGAKASFLEDPVRLLRLLRFAARYDFRLDDEVLRAAEDAQVHKALGELLEHQRGRVLFEVKKALLLHNQPWRFLELCGACEVHPILFTSVPSPLWPGAVGTVRRLGQLLLYGLESEQLTARSQRFRGRIQGGLPPALLTPDWRKLGVWENDWVELLVAALAWRLKSDAITELCDRLQLSRTMGENVRQLLSRARQPGLAAHTQPPGAHLLHCAAASAEAFEDFWQRWPVKPGQL